MVRMKAHQDELPIPNPKVWMTRSAVAARLGVDASTVSRWAAAGVLTQYGPQIAPGETMRWALFYVPEVDQLAAARAKLGGRSVRVA
jgi:hypothetical protein